MIKAPSAMDGLMTGIDVVSHHVLSKNTVFDDVTFFGALFRKEIHQQGQANMGGERSVTHTDGSLHDKSHGGKEQRELISASLDDEAAAYETRDTDPNTQREDEQPVDTQRVPSDLSRENVQNRASSSLEESSKHWNDAKDSEGQDVPEGTKAQAEDGLRDKESAENVQRLANAEAHRAKPSSERPISGNVSVPKKEETSRTDKSFKGKAVRVDPNDAEKNVKNVKDVKDVKDVEDVKGVKDVKDIKAENDVKVEKTKDAFRSDSKVLKVTAQDISESLQQFPKKKATPHTQLHHTPSKGVAEDVSMKTKESGETILHNEITKGTVQKLPVKDMGSLPSMQRLSFARETQVVDQIVGRLRINALRNRSEMDIKLHPPELGSIKMKVILENSVMTGRMEVSSVLVKDIVERHLAVLRQALEDQNVVIDKFDVFVKQEASGSTHDKKGNGFFGKNRNGLNDEVGDGDTIMHELGMNRAAAEGHVDYVI